MVTVPAQSFWAPTRAKLIAAARDMPVIVRGGDWREVGKEERDTGCLGSVGV
jgi:hypothetical protein